MAEPWINKKNWLKGYVEPRKPTEIIDESTEEKAQPEQKQQIQYGIIYYPLECPRCKSKEIKTYSCKIPIRYHKCKKCGYKFKSREASEKELRAKKVITTA